MRLIINLGTCFAFTDWLISCRGTSAICCSCKFLCLADSRDFRHRRLALQMQAVMDKVKADKLREVTDGHDGTWIAHPGLLKIAKQARPALQNRQQHFRSGIQFEGPFHAFYKLLLHNTAGHEIQHNLC